MKSATVVIWTAIVACSFALTSLAHYGIVLQQGHLAPVVGSQNGTEDQSNNTNVQGMQRSRRNKRAFGRRVSYVNVKRQADNVPVGQANQTTPTPTNPDETPHTLYHDPSAVGSAPSSTSVDSTVSNDSGSTDTSSPATTSADPAQPKDDQGSDQGGNSVSIDHGTSDSPQAPSHYGTEGQTSSPSGSSIPVDGTSDSSEADSNDGTTHLPIVMASTFQGHPPFSPSPPSSNDYDSSDPQAYSDDNSEHMPSVISPPLQGQSLSSPSPSTRKYSDGSPSQTPPNMSSVSQGSPSSPTPSGFTISRRPGQDYRTSTFPSTMLKSYSHQAAPTPKAALGNKQETNIASTQSVISTLTDSETETVTVTESGNQAHTVVTVTPWTKFTTQVALPTASPSVTAPGSSDDGPDESSTSVNDQTSEPASSHFNLLSAAKTKQASGASNDDSGDASVDGDDNEQSDEADDCQDDADSREEEDAEDEDCEEEDEDEEDCEEDDDADEEDCEDGDKDEAADESNNGDGHGTLGSDSSSTQVSTTSSAVKTQPTSTDDGDENNTSDGRDSKNSKHSSNSSSNDQGNNGGPSNANDNNSGNGNSGNTPKPTASVSVSSSGSGNGQTFSGMATFFFQNGVAGACGTVHSDSTLLVALDSRMYDGGSHCGATVIITRTSTGKTINAIVADECPTCVSAGSLDLSTGAYDLLGTRDEGTFSITWRFA